MSDFFSHTRVMEFEEEDHRSKVPFPSYLIRDTWLITVNIDLKHLPKAVFLSFLHWNLLALSHLSIQPSLEGSHYVQSTCKEWGVILHLLEGTISTHIIWNSSIQEICLFSQFIYLFIHSLIYISMDSWIFILCTELQSNTTLFCCLNLSSFGHWELYSWLLYPFDISHLCVCVCFRHSLFLALQGAPGSSCIFPAPVLESAILQGVWFPLLENNIRNQDLGAKCVHRYWYVIDSRSSQSIVQGNVFIYVNILTPESIHIFKYLYM